MIDYLIRVHMTPNRKTGVTAIQVDGEERVSHYLEGEAASSAVCAALSVVSRRVAQQQIAARDGFKVEVKFVMHEEGGSGGGQG